MCEDEGARKIAEYICRNNKVATLELLECGITPLGCEFIGRALTPGAGSALQFLKLDHNNIGTQGMKNLVVGLSVNKDIQGMSLQYCGLTAESCPSIFEMLIFMSS